MAFLTVFVMSTGATASTLARAEDDFCARLAANIGIERPATSGAPTSWTVNALNFGQRFLVGGSASTAIGVSPVEPTTVDDYKRLDDMCLPDRKGAACKLVGPADFNFTWKGRKIVTRVETGERATILVAGSKTTCRSEARQ